MSTRGSKRRGKPAADVPRAGVSYRLAIVLASLGLGISGYLAYADLAGTVVACGGLGDCDAAHASGYALIYGLPVSYLGFGAFAFVAVALAWYAVASGGTRFPALLGSLVVVIAGTIFSGYLTYVELFVIRAVCPWCVGSAVTVTALMVVLGVVARREIVRP